MKKILFIACLSCLITTLFAQTVQLVRPVAGDVWKAYTVQKIQWTSNNIANVKIECSLDSGRSWTTIASSYPASATYYNWTIPYKPSDSCFIRISDVLTPPDPGVVYNNPFKIPAAGLSMDSLPAFVYAKTVLPITWTSGGIQKINIYISYDGGTSYKKIADSINTDNGYYNWVIPDTLSNNCFIKLKSAGADSTVVTNTTAFQIGSLLSSTNDKYKGGAYDGHSSANNNPKQVLLTVLSNTESVSGNTTYTIKWQQNNVTLVNLLFSQDNGANWQTIIGNLPASSLSYSWTIPSTPTNTGKIKIVDALDSTVLNVSVANLVIKQKSLKIISPDSLSNASLNTVLPISWTSSGVSVIRVSLLSNNVKKILADSVASVNEMYNWVIPQNATDSFRILVTDRNDSTINDTSVVLGLKTLPQSVVMKYRGGAYDGHAVSANTKPVVHLTYPAGGELLSVSTKYSIKWTATNLDKIRLDISLDSGRTWSLIADSIAASGQSYEWKSPLVPSTKCLIRVRDASDSSLYHINSLVFTLLPKNISNITDSLNWVKGTAKSIEWKSGGIDSVNVSYKISGNNNWILIKNAIPAIADIFNWIVPGSLGDSVWIKLTDAADSTVTDEHVYWGNIKSLVQTFSPVKYQGGSFDGHAQSSNILSKKIIITNPVAFESVAAGSSYTIKWTAINISDSVALQFSIDGGVNWSSIGNVSAAANSYVWQVPKKYTGGQNGNDTAINSNQCQIRALTLPASANVLIGINDRTFAITSVVPVIKSITPAIGTTGDSVYIKGSHLLGASIVKLNTDTVSSFTVLNDSTIKAIVGRGSSGPVYVKNAVGFNTDTTVRFLFTALQKPVITSFTPVSGITGTFVQIIGYGFKSVDSVLFGGLSATSFVVNSDTLITAVLGKGNTGKIGLHNSMGSTLSTNVFTYYNKPVVNSFTPASGTTGALIQISGKGFTGASGVSFGGVQSDSIAVLSDSVIIARVAQGNTGVVRVANPVTFDSSKSDFTFIPPSKVVLPSIKTFTPQYGTTGTNIQITGANFTGVNAAQVGGVSVSSYTVQSDSTMSIVIGTGASGKIVLTNTSGKDTSSNLFTYYTKPLITSFSPATGTQGQLVQINGKGFTGVNKISFGGIKADSILVANDSLIYVRVGSGGTGFIIVSNPLLNDTSKTVFTYLYKPTVSSFTPTSGSSGTVVTITGLNFTGTQSVLIGGTAANYTVSNDSTITATIGTGSTGQITVTNNDGTNKSSGIFTYFKPPVISSFTPINGSKGTVVTIKGSGFNGASAVNFDTIPAISFVVNSDSLITAVVGSGSTGFIKVANTRGTAVSSSQFSYNNVVLVPSISSFSPNSGMTGGLVTITGKNLFLPKTLTIGGIPAIPVSNNGDTIVAMIMPGTISGPVTITTGEGSATSSGNGFTIVNSLYTPAQQGSKLFDSIRNGQMQQGSSVAITADGMTAVIGGVGDNNNNGAAWIYKRNNNTWQQVTKLVANDNTGPASMGSSVSISADGKTVLAGGETDNKNTGAAWVFVNVGNNTWTQEGIKLVPTGAIGSQLFAGHSVSLSADGNTALIGAPGDNSNQGAVWVFTRNGSSWIQQGQKLTGSDNTGAAAQGSSVAISADGNTFVQGGINDNSSTGAVWVFTKKNNSWVQQGSKLVANDKTGASKQGASVAISADGNKLIYGASADNNSVGAAWIFTRTDSVWTQDGAKLTGKGMLGAAAIGTSVGLSADGTVAIVGQKTENNNIGSTSIYKKSNGSWKQQGLKLSASDALGMAMLGNSVAISADGNTSLVGGSGDLNGAGAAWTFIPANNWTGSVSNDWSTPANWSYGSIPQKSDVVVITKTTNQPVVNTSAEISKLIIDSAAIVTLNGPLTVSAGISNNGSISGTSSVVISTKSTQQIIGNGIVRNVTLSDSSIVSIDDDTTSVSGSIEPNSGLLKANGKLKLLSTSNGSARVGIGNGSYLTGNVIVQRFVSNLPDWRMIGFPFTDSSKIKVSDLKVFFPYGYSAFSYSEPAVTNGNINTGWSPFSYGQITAEKGILFSGVPVTTMQLSAPVNTGTIRVPLSYTQLNLNNGWNLISNPFPANIDWNSIISNNPSGLQNAIYRYDPYTSSYAAYVNGVSTGSLNNIIENGAGFFVRSIGATALNVRESDKTSSVPIKSLAGFPSSPSPIVFKSAVRLSLLTDNEKSGDEVVVRWGVDPATDRFDDKFDAFDLGRNRLADLSIVGDDKTLYSIFHGSELKYKENEKRAIDVRTVNMHPGSYRFESNLLSPMYDDNELYLVDNYLRKSILVSRDSSTYSFIVTSDSLSASNSRFKLVFNYKAPDEVSSEGSGIQLLNNPSSVNQFVLMSDSEYKQVEWKLVDQRGVQIKSGMIYNLSKGQTKATQTGNISAGLYIIRLVADGQLLPPLKWIKE